MSRGGSEVAQPAISAPELQRGGKIGEVAAQGDRTECGEQGDRGDVLPVGRCRQSGSSREACELPDSKEVLGGVKSCAAKVAIRLGVECLFC